MIDIHSHILYGMDDGAASLEESIELCKIGYENNLDVIFATPHYTFDTPLDEFVFLRDKRIAELRQALTGLGLPVSILAGAEVFAGEDLFYANASDLRKLALAETNYVLVEFPFKGLNTSAFWAVLDLFLDCRLCPVIAHPERYEIFQKDPRLGIDVARAGFPMQVNIGSPAGNLGPEVKQCAERLLMLECVSFLATDAHDSRYRSTELIDIYNRLCGKFPNIDLFSLLEDNPNALMSNKIIRTKYYRQ